MTEPDRVDEVANMLYVTVVNPDLTWWDDLTPEMQEGWRRAARKVIALPPDLKTLASALWYVLGEYVDAPSVAAATIAVWKEKRNDI